MGTVHYFDAIAVTTPYEAIYRRLGYRQGVTGLSPLEKEETEASIEKALALIRLRGATLRLPARREGDKTIILPDGSVFESRRLFKFVGACEEILLMAATAGPEIMREIQADTAGRNVTRGVVLDAAAGEITDAALDWIMGYMNQSLRREGRRLLTARYSAGYGDLPLESQQTMHRLLGLEKIGVAITESCILVPEKSVTAITGIVS
jgi:hypothetical protein